MKPHAVAVLAHPPLPTLELGLVSELFGGPAPDEAKGGWYRLAFAAIEPGPVACDRGMVLFAGNGLDQLARSGTVLVPGWAPADPVPGAVVEALRGAAAAGARLVSLGTGAWALAAAGLLDGRRVVVHWSQAEALAAAYPRLVVASDILFADEGRIVTGAGQATALDLLLHLVRRDHGGRAANAVARRLAAPPARGGDQVQCVARPVPRMRDARLARVAEYVRANAALPLRTPDLAAMAAMSERSFNRKFRDMFGQAPYDYLLHQRVAIARELLEESELSVDEVGAEAGFGSTQSLRNAFRNVVGVNPARYRRRSAAAAPAWRARPVR